MKAHNKIIFFKRHGTGCDVLKRRSMTPSKARFILDCECPVWIMGKTPMGDLVPRQTTGVCDLKEAERKVAMIIEESRKQHTSTPVHGLTLVEAIDRYIRYRKDRDDCCERTMEHTVLALSRLQSFCHAHQVVYVRELHIDLLTNFRVDGLPTLKNPSKRNTMGKIKRFLRVAFRRGWIAEHLAGKMDSETQSVQEQKMPYTPEEVKTIFAGVKKLKRGTKGYSKYPETFGLLLKLIYETGMRAGDAARFNPSVLEKGAHLWKYTFVPQKQQKAATTVKHVTVYISNALKISIDNCKWLSDAGPFFYAPNAHRNYLSTHVYDRMQTIGRACRINDCRPHRLRDTFAVNKLLAGMSLDDVSRLLGHSSVKVTEMYYARWTKPREDRLERLVFEAS